MIRIPRLCSMSVLRESVEKENIHDGEHKYIFIVFSDKETILGYRCLERMNQFAEDTNSAMVYADYLDPAPHPLIDYQQGSLRDDFDFGGLWLVKTELLESFLAHETTEWKYVSPYALRLFLSRNGQISHLRETLYTQQETDLRRSGEKQFDYVDPRNIEVQKEAEQACTNHLKAVGAWLREDEIDDLPADETDYPVEASVIIPVRNRVRTIKDAVGSALSQKTDFDFNIIVIDNYSSDGTGEAVASMGNEGRVVCLRPDREDLGIGGCWDYAIRSRWCGRYAVQLDSDDLYSSEDTLQRIVEKFREENAAMVIGSYRMVDFKLNTLPPGLIDHKEWTAANGRNNALRINGLGAPRAFRTDILRKLGFPNTSYGEDYALGLAISRRWRIGRIFDELYLCRRWEGNSDAALSIEKQNKNNLYKDLLRTEELTVRMSMIKTWKNKVVEADVENFFERQMTKWEEVRKRFEKLTESVLTKELTTKEETQESQDENFDPCILSAQHNPCRIVSTGAKIDAKTIAARPCFLCDKNRPSQQISLPIEGKYQVLVNPFPILQHHLTISARRHKPQTLAGGLGALVSKLAWNMPRYVVFYNGPHSGASAPDHAHLQAGLRGTIPIERDWKKLEPRLEKLFPLNSHDILTFEQRGYKHRKFGIYYLKGYACPALVIRGEHSGSAELINMLTAALAHSARHDHDAKTQQSEAEVNVVSWRQYDEVLADSDIVTIVFPRSKHRPECYYTQGVDGYLISPGAVDMAGLIVTPRKEDYDKLTYEKASEILREVSLTEAQMRSAVQQLSHGSNFSSSTSETANVSQVADNPCRMVSVGLMSDAVVRFTLNGEYEAKGGRLSGSHVAEFSEGGILWQGNIYSELLFRPVKAAASQGDSSPTFTIENIVIGKKFHWERSQQQTFMGNLRLRVEEEKIVVINELPVEEYLKSVISSEMSQNSSLEFLKAHAVISRSWLLFQQQHRQEGQHRQSLNIVRKENEYLRWYDNDEHTLFDVCADDHCQRYQGISHAENPVVAQAVSQTAGQVLSYQDQVCDARFSKCCGGHTETYSTCWDEREVPYLQSVYDGDEQGPFCNTHDKHLLSQILNDYDQETSDFFSWQVHYTNDQLSKLIEKKSGLDFGRIISLTPLTRGPGGHISRLEIHGDKRTLVVGKELEIRRLLSESHLYSSAFSVEPTPDGGFTLNGRGWGHGVGLCQIGAAVMAEKGYDYKEILQHYYPGAEIKILKGF